MSMLTPRALLGKAFRSIANAAKHLLNVDGRRKPMVLSDIHVTPKERELVIDEFHVKRKLGSSYFRKRLNPRTRARRLAALTCEEMRIARAHGWVL